MTLLTGQNEQLVNSTTLNDQRSPAIARLADGYVVVWQSLQTPADYDNPRFPAGYDIYMQRYSDAGVAVGGEVRVNSVTFNDQVQPTVVALADGGFAIAWASAREQAIVNFDYGVYLQRFDANGARAGGETQVNDFYFLNQQRPSIAALSGGGFVVTWTSDTQAPSPPGVYAKRFGADGLAIGGDVRIESMNFGASAASSVTGLADGGYVIVWDGSGDIHAQRFDASGIAQTAVSQVNTTAADMQSGPAVTVLAGGGYVVAWDSPAQDGSGSGVYMQRYDAAGAPAGVETRVNTTVAGSQSAPSVTAMDDGGFLVAWESAAQDGSGSGIYAQRYAASGQAVGAETRINSTTANDQSAAAIASNDGGFVAGWMSLQQDGSGLGVYSRIFSIADSAQPQARSGDGYVHGTAGLDVAIINSSASGILSYSLNGGVLTVTTEHGTQHIDKVERIRLTDALFALDTAGPSEGARAGHVWEAAALFRAAFNVAPDGQSLSRWTAQADRSRDMGELGQKMIDFYAPGVSNAGLVAHLYQSLVGHAADAPTVRALTGQIGADQQFATQGDFFAHAASLDLNTAHVAGMVGIIQPLDAAWF